jgi:hypothetical protein
VGVRIDGKVDWSVMARLVAQAYGLVTPPRLRETLGSAPAPTRARKR